MPMSRRYINTIFKSFAANRDYFDFDDYQRVTVKDPDILLWLTKPEEVMNAKLNKRLDDNMVSREQMISKLEAMKDQAYEYFDELSDKMKQCLEVFDQKQSL
jgi:thymidylate kinase